MNVALRSRARIEPEGAAVWDDLGPAVFPVVRPLNDLLALRDEQEYLSWLEQNWQRWARPRSARKWTRDGVQDRLSRAARRAARGRLPYAELADLLEQVRYGQGELDAPNLPVLAAWALQEVTRLGHHGLKCEECGYLWFSVSSKQRYCYRPAPGKTMTCAQLHAHERFAAQRERWNKEYRRIYARKLRGTVSEADWQAWRADEWGSVGAPDSWIPFDMWKHYREAQTAAKAAADASLRREAEQNIATLLRVLEEFKKQSKEGGNGNGNDH